mmetsp:Transcript_35463/g.101007  ORF Transcript_35463/g.101007 Transcript_35463/m.101007 type:complete len:209 (+) Transcript_35463:179-805(+)
MLSPQTRAVPHERGDRVLEVGAHRFLGGVARGRSFVLHERTQFAQRGRRGKGRRRHCAELSVVAHGLVWRRKGAGLGVRRRALRAPCRCVLGARRDVQRAFGVVLYAGDGARFRDPPWGPRRPHCPLGVLGGVLPLLRCVVAEALARVAGEAPSWRRGGAGGRWPGLAGCAEVPGTRGRAIACAWPVVAWFIWVHRVIHPPTNDRRTF